MKLTWLNVLGLVGLLVAPRLWANQLGDHQFDHQLWDNLLRSNVVASANGGVTAVDYGAMERQSHILSAYLKSLSAVSRQTFDSWADDEQLAFLINAYNAWTIELILTQWPDVESIRELGGLFSSPWKKQFIPLFSLEVSLDHIEHQLIRGSGRYRDPRIHFAVNCASISCPALRTEAYVADRLSAQLDEQAELFLADSERNRWSGEKLELSSIFKWYREDFERGWRGFDSLEQFVLRYGDGLKLNAQAIDQLEQGQAKIKFLTYDWDLNKTP